MTMFPVFIPIQQETVSPLWTFEGDWDAKDKAKIESVLTRYTHKYRRSFGLLRKRQKRWILTCRVYETEKDYYASFGVEVILFSNTVDELAEQIEKFSMTGVAPEQTIRPASNERLRNKEEQGDGEYLDNPTVEQKAGVNAENTMNWKEKLLQLRREANNVASDDNIQDASELDKQLLVSISALRLLREMNRFLLDGHAKIEIFYDKNGYRFVIALLWEGSIHSPSPPSSKSEKVNNIFIGVVDGKVYVNGEEVTPPTLQNLQSVLLVQAEKIIRTEQEN